MGHGGIGTILGPAHNIVDQGCLKCLYAGFIDGLVHILKYAPRAFYGI